MNEVPTAPVAPQPTPAKVEVDLSKVTPYKVERNGIDFALTPFAGRRGNWAGVVYQAPQVEVTEGKPLIEDTSFINGLNFIGKDTVARILNIFCKRFAQDAHEDAIPTTNEKEPGYNKDIAGIFQVDKFLRSIKEFSVAQLRISELRELHDEAVAQYMTFSTGEFIKVMTAGTPEEKTAIIAKMETLGKTVAQYKSDLDARLEKKSKETETDTVRPE